MEIDRRHGPAFDPELASVLAAVSALTASVLPTQIDLVRKGVARLRSTDDQLTCGGAVEWQERVIPASAGAEQTVLLLRPTAVTTPIPALCFLHGGGMVAGDARTGIEAVLDWVWQLGIGVVSVAYRLAPEHPHPIPVEDCYAALYWLDRHRQELSIDESPLLLAGASAGGGLAAGVALLARERNGPHIGELLLMAPMLDDAARFPSSIEFNGDAPWDARSNQTGWSALLGQTVGDDAVPIAAAPSRADDLSGLPPTFLDVGALETFRDETIDFAVRLAQAQVTTELHVWSGAFHGFDVVAPNSAVARTARGTRLEYLKRRLSQRESKSSDC